MISNNKQKRWNNSHLSKASKVRIKTAVNWLTPTIVQKSLQVNTENIHCWLTRTVMKKRMPCKLTKSAMARLRRKMFVLYLLSLELIIMTNMTSRQPIVPMSQIIEYRAKWSFWNVSRPLSISRLLSILFYSLGKGKYTQTLSFFLLLLIVFIYIAINLFFFYFFYIFLSIFHGLVNII